jgi:hypothetical protein
MDDSRLEQLKLAIDEIKKNQERILLALIGGVDKSVGLIEESRNLRKDVEALGSKIEIHEVKIQEFSEFKGDAKKVVAIIGLTIPIVIEICKSLYSSIFNSKP